MSQPRQKAILPAARLKPNASALNPPAVRASARQLQLQSEPVAWFDSSSASRGEFRFAHLRESACAQRATCLYLDRLIAARGRSRTKDTAAVPVDLARS